jgi:PQQ-dependent dehydrogenase (methanol/ethanol family)
MRAAGGRRPHCAELLCMALAAAGAAGIDLASAAGDVPARNTDWPYLGGTLEAQHFSPLAQVNERNIGRLGLAWYADMGTPDGLVGNALVVDGTVYQAGPGARIYANDVRTGRPLWVYDPNSEFKGSLATFFGNRYTRGLALWKDDVYVGTGDCRLVAVNRRTGVKHWDIQSCDPSAFYTISGAPRVGGGKVFIGNTDVDSGSNRGFVDAFDAATGKHLWRFYTVPGDPSKGFENDAMAMAAKTWGMEWWKKTGGGSAWEAMTYDPVLNMLYVGTDSAKPLNPMERGTNRGDELFSNSIVALNADTGKYLWHYQTTPNDAWDFNSSMHILVANLTVGGAKRRVVMQAPKNGFFYVLDARTGKLLSAKNFVPVNWASSVDLQTGRPVELPAARYYAQPDGKAIVVPGPLGAHNWHAMSYSAQTGLIYIPAMETAALWEVTNGDGTVLIGGGHLHIDQGIGPDTHLPGKVSGKLIAWDPVNQQVRWQQDLDLPFNGGVLSTAGGVVFQGTGTGEIVGYQAETGRKLWSFYTGSATQAAPSTIMVDGEQLILFPVGAGGALSNWDQFTSTEKSRGPARLLAFKLGGTAQLPPYQYAAVFPRPPRPRYAGDLVSKGRTLYEDVGCGMCHAESAMRSGGRVPDLRKASAETHDTLAAIVIGGARQAKGMPSFSGTLTMEQLDELQAYIIDQAWNAYDAQEAAKVKH